MGKAQKKTGKGRLDKYYKLAKEQGYRARSAFKLIQLNKKYSFLETARCTIDLCAAPGGWLQVSSKYMPVNSVIIGVDLVPIKPIPRVVTFAADITTPQCGNLIRGELKDWKADVVLHDGAPNVGTAWIQDAYSQSELVLMSLKLAVGFLAKGGTFVTKVFRSVDYNNLIWVFNQLFGKVEATKPPSSRNVSAEIFVVCRDFLAPKIIDPKFLDPRHVFKEIASPEITIDKGSSSNNVQANVFQPDKKRRHRDGYAAGDYTLHRAISATDFVRGSDPIVLLGSCNKIAFVTDEEKKWLAMDITSVDVKANCEDLKVLGKGDFKVLIKWRLALREELGLDNRTRRTEELIEATDAIGEIDPEQQITEEVERMNAEAASRAKRDRRRANEVKMRTVQRMQLQMTSPLDIGLEQHDMSLGGQEDFLDLEGSEKGLRERRGLGELIGDDGHVMDESDEEVNHESDETSYSDDMKENIYGMEDQLDGLYTAYQNRLRERDAKFKVKEARQNDANREGWSGIQDENDEDDSDEGGWGKIQEAKIIAEDSSDEDNSEDGDYPLAIVGSKRPASYPSHGSKRARLTTEPEEPSSSVAVSKTTQVWFSQDIFSRIDELHENYENDMLLDSNLELDNVIGHNDGEFEVAPQQPDDDLEIWNVEEGNENEVKRAQVRGLGIFAPEAMTIAQQLVNRQTTITHLVNDGFNRHSLNHKEGLPAWFLDDESKHYKPNLPITKEAIIALREKQRALDARPIKKVAEAKARKKFKAQQRLEKAVKKADGVNATADISEREKAEQIQKLMRKSMSKKPKAKKDIKVVVAKGAHKGIKGRPNGVKGRYTMVDSRMKKELRAKRRVEKANKKRKKT